MHSIENAFVLRKGRERKGARGREVEDMDEKGREGKVRGRDEMRSERKER